MVNILLFVILVLTITILYEVYKYIGRVEDLENDIKLMKEELAKHLALKDNVKDVCEKHS